MGVQITLRLPRACLTLICSNFLFFWSCELRFRWVSYQVLKRWFPGSFLGARFPAGYLPPLSDGWSNPTYENFDHSWPKTIKILRIWQLRLVISLWHYYNTTNMIMFPRFMFASDGHCHHKTDPFGIARGLCAKKTLRKSKFQELIRNASKSQLTTPKKTKS